jgi:hypothetical protein
MSTKSLEEFIDNHFEQTHKRLSQVATVVRKTSQKGRKGKGMGKKSVSGSAVSQSQQQHSSTEFYTPMAKAKASAKRKIRSFDADTDPDEDQEFTDVDTDPDEDPEFPDSQDHDNYENDDNDNDDDDNDDNDDNDVFMDADADLPQLTQCNDKDEILSVLSSWLGEMNTQMRHTFQERFDEAMEQFKAEVQDSKNSADSTDSVIATDSTEIIRSLTSQGKAIDDIQKENKELQSRCRVLEGRLTRAEREIEELREDSLMQQARSMRDNIKFFNIPEPEDEAANCESTVRTFLREEMKVQQHDLQQISFDRIHRTGRHINNKHRVIVAKVNPDGKHIIFQHIKYLDRAKRYGISDQLPRELEERKKRLLPEYKEAKKDKNKNVKWSVDKLVVDGKVKTVRKDKVMDVHLNTTKKAVTLQPTVRHSPTQTYQGHSFQGHSVSITEQDDIVPVLHAIYSDGRVARASHNIYAYRLKTTSGYIEHYEDDGEWGAGADLLDLLRSNNIENKLVCTTRWRGTNHLASARLSECVLKAAKGTLQL